MARFHPALTHSISAVVAATAAVVFTFSFIDARNAKRQHHPPTQEAVRDAGQRLSTSLAIKFSDVSSPAVDGQALAILRSRQEARIIINSDSSTDAEKGAAQIIEGQRTRQLE